MSQAVTELLVTLDKLEEIAEGLGSVAIGQDAARSKESLVLNGLHVVAFAAIEDFLRRRAYEVILAIGKDGIKFDDLPDSFKTYVLEQTIEGVLFSLSRSEITSRVTHLQIQGMLIGATSDSKAIFEPSEYFFGRSQSNVSTAHIKHLLDALVVEGGWQCLTQIAAQVGQMHLGAPDQIFTRLAKNRHSAAHGFNNDYKRTEFINDMRSGARVLSFAFDTCISQWAFKLRQAAKKSEIFGSLKVATIDLWRIEFDPTSEKWLETRNGKTAKSVSRLNFTARLAHHRSVTTSNGDSILKIDGQGKIDAWMQPIR